MGKKVANGEKDLPESVEVVIYDGYVHYFLCHVHSMNTCTRHPERPATQYCQKHYRYFCDECMTCSNPKLYCPHRTSCIIWFLEREKRREDREEEQTRDEAA